MTMFSRRTLLFGVAALVLFGLTVTAGKGGKKPPPDPPPPADPAILYIERGHFPDYSLWVMDADGANKTEIVSLPDIAVRDGDWSPDNTQLVLQLEDTNVHVWGFYLCDADGANLERILHNWWTGSFGTPQWVLFSTGEERIVYYPQNVQSNLPGQASGIWSMKIDGTGHCEMMPEDPDQDGRRVRQEGDVSQDGSLIVFTYDYLGQYRHVALGHVGFDEADCPVVVSEEALTEVAGSPLQGSDAFSPAIDPTGTMVAVSAGQVTDAGLWIIPIADPASPWRVPVDNADGFPTSASWLDARTVVYHRYSGKKHELFKADIYLGKETKLASASGRTSLMAPKARN
jgi:hypothetical protein